MSSWCLNTLFVVGKKSEVRKLVKGAVKSKENNKLSFLEAYFPCPDDLEYGGECDEGIKLKYGYSSGAEWCQANWGTSRSDFDVEVQYKDGASEATIQFETYRDPPLIAYGNISKQFPSLVFHLSYLSLDYYYRGDACIANGEVDNDHHEYDSIEDYIEENGSLNGDEDWDKR
jgi:hypothetical protein